ncbi:MAG TPA: GNAT family N-acetyltransferase [Candidatus Eisenbacteria bacterium]|nr:GNAT family N-acetyltransferase [Candidatus Eisenbacteria bacterium]
MAPRTKPAETDSSLKREVAGRYVTRDGRFAVEQSSSGWLLIDGEATDELGQPLIRGQFPTLDEARVAIVEARTGPPPVSELERRLGDRPQATGRRRGTRERGRASSGLGEAGKGAAGGRSRTPGAAGGRSRTPAAPTAPESEAPPVQIREYRRSDGAALRDLWREAGFRLRGDDDDSLATMARRNPGLLLVATAAKEIVGSALGAWDGRHGWIYHMATAESHRRSGVGRSLVREVERRLAAVGCHDVNVNVGETNVTAQRFWVSVGYPAVATGRYRKELSER